MQARAVARFIKVAPSKLRKVARLVRGRQLEEARAVLAVMPSPAAQALRLVVESAAANAENNHDMSRDELRVARVAIDEGLRMKRFRAAPRGKPAPRLRRTSHVTVVVEDES